MIGIARDHPRERFGRGIDRGPLEAELLEPKLDAGAQRQLQFQDADAVDQRAVLRAEIAQPDRAVFAQVQPAMKARDLPVGEDDRVVGMRADRAEAFLHCEPLRRTIRLSPDEDHRRDSRSPLRRAFGGGAARTPARPACRWAIGCAAGVWLAWRNQIAAAAPRASLSPRRESAPRRGRRKPPLKLLRDPDRAIDVGAFRSVRRRGLEIEAEAPRCRRRRRRTSPPDRRAPCSRRRCRPPAGTRS